MRRSPNVVYVGDDLGLFPDRPQIVVELLPDRIVLCGDIATQRRPVRWHRAYPRCRPL